MRYAADHKAQTRERIVRAASRRFRARGRDGSDIAGLMRELRLTHGGFYRHFRSKEALFEAALAQSVQEVGERLMGAAELAPPAQRLEVIVGAYLSMEHCDHPADGCPLAALASDIARQPKRVQAACGRLLTAHARGMATFMPGNTDDERMRRAVILFTGMAGTLSLARTMADAGERRQLLDAAKTFYLRAVR